MKSFSRLNHNNYNIYNKFIKTITALILTLVIMVKYSEVSVLAKNCSAQMFQLKSLLLSQMRLYASLNIPVRITGPGTIGWSGEREIKREWAWASPQHSLLVFTSCAACLSRFALIKTDKGSLIGCRCAALMSVTATPLSRRRRLTEDAHLHVSFDALQHLPNSPVPCLLPVHTCSTCHTLRHWTVGTNASAWSVSVFLFPLM